MMMHLSTSRQRSTNCLYESHQHILELCSPLDTTSVNGCLPLPLHHLVFRGPQAEKHSLSVARFVILYQLLRHLLYCRNFLITQVCMDDIMTNTLWNFNNFQLPVIFNELIGQSNVSSCHEDCALSMNLRTRYQRVPMYVSPHRLLPMKRKYVGERAATVGVVVK